MKKILLGFLILFFTLVATNLAPTPTFAANVPDEARDGICQARNNGAPLPLQIPRPDCEKTLP